MRLAIIMAIDIDRLFLFQSHINKQTYHTDVFKCRVDALAERLRARCVHACAYVGTGWTFFVGIDPSDSQLT
jgi:hypothetical protein